MSIAGALPIPVAQGRLLNLLLPATVLLSAFLLFQVQPLMSKAVLPWYGGGPSVWTTAMLFFQSLLFLGYAYAHGVARFLSLRQQTLGHIALLALAALLAGFILPGAALKPEGTEHPVASILTLLLVCVGLPYFCLSTTGPLVQHWFSRAYPGRSPYRLYALSNLGSFFALLSFPFLFEPLLAVPAMAGLWSWAFWLFAALAAGAAWQLKDLPLAAPAAPVHDDATPAPGLRERLAWVGLPALASLAFIATTDRVSHHVAPEPRLWITSLSLYLLTFIICFDHERWYRRRVVAGACLAAVLLLPASAEMGWDIGVTGLRWSHFLVMFLVCLLCHGELVRAKPRDHRYLTEFYLWMSLGGALGGLFVALVASQFFNDFYEWPLCLGAVVAVATWVLCRSAGRQGRIAWLMVGGLVAGCVLWLTLPMPTRSSTAEAQERTLFQGRNFYGTVAVEEVLDRQDPSLSYRVFRSGQINHGVQFLQADKRTLPVAYHAASGGAGQALEYAKARQPALRVGVVGMGIASLAHYARESDAYDFFEINPQVIAIADTLFDNLKLCKAHEKRVILGDARLELDKLAASVKYDVLVLDAFSGGSVPTHLLTQEAFAIYIRHLQPGGLIVINITNAYLNLHPVVKRQAEALQMGYRFRFGQAEPDRMIRRTRYAILTHDAGFLRTHPDVYRQHFTANGRLLRTENPDLPGIPLWTDAFSSINAIEIRN